jgi:hypothetical protein
MHRLGAAQSHKRVLTERSCPLSEPGISELVLSFLAWEGIYVKTVCKEWSACYEKLMAAPQKRRTPMYLILHLHSCSCTDVSVAFTSAARVRLAGLWGLRFDKPDSYKLRYCAGKHGDISTLLAAHELGLPYSHEVVREAAESGCLEKLKWLSMEQGCQMPDDIADSAAGGGSVEMPRWLKQRGFVFTEGTSYRAAGRANNLRVLQYLLEEGCPLPRYICGAAAEAGDVQQLQWLYEHGAELSSTTAELGADGGSVEVLEWLQQQGVEFEFGSMIQAAEDGNLQVCQWLHAAGCQMDGCIYDVAAHDCNLKLLNWLFDVGYPYDPMDLCNFLVDMQDCDIIPVLQCFQERGVFDSAATLTLVLNCAGANNTSLAAAQWLRQQGAEWPAELYSDHEDGPGPWYGETLEWARAEGCTAPVPDDDEFDY